MRSLTHVANTRDWLEASKEMKIKFTFENSISTISMYQSPIPVLDFHDALKRISLPVSVEPSVVKEPSLDSEFRTWETLSDEALTNFEYALR